MIRKRMAMWALACMTSVWAVGCGDSSSGNDCLSVLPAAPISGSYRARNFTRAFSNCPADTTEAVLAVFQAVAPKEVLIRYDQDGHDTSVPGNVVEFEGCADEDSTVQTEGDFSSLVQAKSEACNIRGGDVTLTTGVSSTAGALTGNLGFPLKISSECRTCLTDCYVTIGFQLLREATPLPGTPTPTPDPALVVDLDGVVRQALQAGLDSAPPATCAPTNTPVSTPTPNRAS